MDNIGESLFQAGVQKIREGNHEAATELFESASQHEHMGAFYNLGLQCKYGLSSFFDQDKAQRYFESAQRLGHHKAPEQLKLYEKAKLHFNDWSIIQELIEDSGSMGVGGPLINAIINWNVSELKQEQAQKYVLMELDYLSTFSMQTGGNPFVDRFLSDFGIDEDEYLGVTAGGRVSLTSVFAANCSNRTAKILFEEVLKVGTPPPHAVYSRCVTTRLIANHYELSGSSQTREVVGLTRFYKTEIPADW